MCVSECVFAIMCAYICQCVRVRTRVVFEKFQIQSTRELRRRRSKTKRKTAAVVTVLAVAVTVVVTVTVGLTLKPFVAYYSPSQNSLLLLRGHKVYDRRGNGRRVFSTPVCIVCTQVNKQRLSQQAIKVKRVRRKAEKTTEKSGDGWVGRAGT